MLINVNYNNASACTGAFIRIPKNLIVLFAQRSYYYINRKVISLMHFFKQFKFLNKLFNPLIKYTCFT